MLPTPSQLPMYAPSIRPASDQDGDNRWATPIPVALAFIAAELAAALLSDTIGLIAYFSILFALLMIAAMINDHKERRFLTSAALVPIMRLAHFAMPLNELSEPYRLLLECLPTLIGMGATMRATATTPEEIALTSSFPKSQWTIATSGIPLAVVGYIALKPDPLVPGITLETWQDALIPSLVLAIYAGFVNIAIFQGMIQHSMLPLAQSRSSISTLLLVAVMYTITQTEHLSPFFSAYTLGTGIFYAWAVKRTGTIWGTSIASGITAIGIYILIPSMM